MEIQLPFLQADDIFQFDHKFEEVFNSLSLEDMQLVNEYLLDIFRDVMEYFAAMMSGRLAEYLSRSPHWAWVGSAIVYAEITPLIAPFPCFTLRFAVERNRGRIVLNELSRRYDA